MRFNSTMILALFLVFGLAAMAQHRENRNEVSIAGTGFFTKDMTNGSFHHEATDTGGGEISYRFDFNTWLAGELNYGFTRNSQEYFNAGAVPGAPGLLDRFRVNIHQATAGAVVRLPFSIGRVTPYVLAGTGALIFDPEDCCTTTSAGAAHPSLRIPTRSETVFAYGGGVDVGQRNLFGSTSVALRIGYRGFLYDVPDFGGRLPNLDTVTHTAQPEAGVTFRF